MNHNDEKDAYEFCKHLEKYYREAPKESNERVLLNPIQYRKLQKAYFIMETIAKEQNGKLTSMLLNPADLHAWLEIELPGLDTYGHRLSPMRELLGLVDAFGINPTQSNTIKIGITVKSVWRKRT